MKQLLVDHTSSWPSFDVFLKMQISEAKNLRSNYKMGLKSKNKKHKKNVSLQPWSTSELQRMAGLDV